MTQEMEGDKVEQRSREKYVLIEFYFSDATNDVLGIYDRYEDAERVVYDRAEDLHTEFEGALPDVYECVKPRDGLTLYDPSDLKRPQWQIHKVSNQV